MPSIEQCLDGPVSVVTRKARRTARPWLWCGGVASYVAAIKEPRYEDYHIEYHSQNRWSFIGMGKIKG